MVQARPTGGARASAPRFEHHDTALGVGEPSPRLSWVTTSEEGWVQRGYELQVRRGREAGDDVVTWAVESPDSVLVPWPEQPLRSRERAEVRVRARGDDGAGPWSDWAAVEAGLLSPSDWRARPVGPPVTELPGDGRRPPLLRRSFRLGAVPGPARLYATAHGVLELEVNGHRVGEDVLSPGWTSYSHRLRYRTYDVTDLLHEGENVVGAWLGDGWYRGRLGFHGGFHDLYGQDLSLLAQLEVTLADGTRQQVVTDRSWRWSHGPVVASGLYDGESYDAREERDGWSSPGYDGTTWSPVVEHERDPVTLVAPTGPPVRRTESLAPVEVTRRDDGRYLLDFGQNLTGRLRLSVRGPRGTEVVLRHAEVLQDGELATRPLRGAKATDTYVLRGSDAPGAGPEVWEPRFTFHGFRYAEVRGWPGALAEGDVTAQVLHTDMRRTGWFSCSDPLVQRLHENVVWGMRGNFLDIPTDCPQRDERLGWTGDIQVFAPTASFLYDCAGMLTDWLEDVAAEQYPDGTVPWYVPEVPSYDMWYPARPGAVWGDVVTLTPATLHERFGDVGVLRQQYRSATRWVDLVERLAGEDRVWDTGFQLGDWLDPAAPPEDPADARTDRYLVATAYFARSAQVLSRTAALLGESADAQRYGRLARQVREAFVARYLREDGRLTSDAQTAYALALAFDLLPAGARQAAGDRLAELVAAEGNRIGTGFAGTNVISDALTGTGHLDTAYDLLLERGCPSWLYTVTMGATTIWERWDSLRPDGSVNPGGMTSFNHYALGAVADWLHRVVAGLSPLEPGYRRMLVRPQPGGGLTWAEARHLTPYGEACVRWDLDGARLSVAVTVPTGATARVELPSGRSEELGPGRHELVDAEDAAA